METLEITTGLKRIDIVRDGAQVGQISFNPLDASFADRFYQVLTEFQKKMDEYKALYTAMKTDSEDPAPQQIELLKETCEYVRGRIDFLFGDGTSQTVFGEALVLEAFEQFFDKISPFILSARVAKVQDYMPKATRNGHKPKRTRTKK